MYQTANLKIKQLSSFSDNIKYDIKNNFFIRRIYFKILNFLLHMKTIFFSFFYFFATTNIQFENSVKKIGWNAD